jgi:predicted ATPase
MAPSCSTGGIPDFVAHAGLFDLDAAEYEHSAKTHLHNPTVFHFAVWADIDPLDDERRMDLESANRFGEQAAGVYRRLGYRPLEVPRIPIDERLRFFVDAIQGKHAEYPAAEGE